MDVMGLPHRWCESGHIDFFGDISGFKLLISSLFAVFLNVSLHFLPIIKNCLNKYFGFSAFVSIRKP